MKNSFLIKTVGKAFDSYYHQHKKVKKNSSPTKGDHELHHIMEIKKGKIEGRVPKPRDGHSWVVHDERFLLIFGGDRHHMPFNDLFALDMAKEI